MPALQVKRLLTEIKQGLLSLYGNRLKAVYLFGSYARGDYHEGSDFDVMIVLETYKSYWDELVRSAALASDLSLKYEVTISRTLMTEEQWKAKVVSSTLSNEESPLPGCSGSLPNGRFRRAGAVDQGFCQSPKR